MFLLSCRFDASAAKLFTFKAVENNDKKPKTLLLATARTSQQTSILGQTRVFTEECDVDGHNLDWYKAVKGSGKLLLKPKTAEEVSAILTYCNDTKLAVTPQGGNTGVSGGAIPVFDEIILSTSQMNKIISFDEISGVLVCEAGCILDTLNEYLMEKNFIMPLDLGSKGSCNIGGNVSTNAGGLRVIRYGSLHGTVLGVEAVLANGTIMDCLSLMKKDNTGYDLKHLLIGSEGTLGVVTKVAIQCPVKPKSVQLALFGISNFSGVLETFKQAKQNLGEILSACEYMDQTAIESVVRNLNIRNPIGDFPFYMIIETSGSNEQHDEEKLNTFLEKIMADGVVQDGTVASDYTQIRSIWELRERIIEAQLLDGFVYLSDFSVPVNSFDRFVHDVQNQVGDSGTVTGFGHLGDSNIHLHVISKEYTPELLSKIEPFVYEWTSKKRGSVSAEHGLGFKKKDYLSYSKSESVIDLMRNVKSIFDPNHILNPYKVLPDKK
ncbi:unnamed protein product [Allacma fusca]|uniref:D-2-hydroxyglutarate dehydrogenase, mitochondrial n=1 Tax=Allacma fusca TaxID=39272 RepID=A0A8J2K3Q4_9HEXA|nr:unnamed protein product [Allacma fusca]